MIPLLLILLCLCGCDDFDERSITRVHMGTHHTTGFWYSEGVIVTSAHLADEGTGDTWIEYLDDNCEIQTIEPIDVFVDFESDKMFLVVDEPGTPVDFCNVPTRTIIQVWYWVDDGPENIQGIVLWRWKNKYWTSAPTRAGYSGGPAVKGDCVIGLTDGSTSIDTTVILRLEEN